MLPTSVAEGSADESGLADGRATVNGDSAGDGDGRDFVATAARLDSVAKVLAGATAAVAALLTTFGVTSDRIWTLLDNDRLASWIIYAGALAVLSIGCSLIALFLPPRRIGWQTVFLAVGALFYVSSLVGALLVVGEAADRAGAPVVQSASISNSGNRSLLDLRVISQQLDPGQVIDVSVKLGSLTLYKSSSPADSDGKVDQAISVPLPAKTDEQALLVTAWRSDRGDPDCDRIRTSGPSCVTILIDGDG